MPASQPARLTEKQREVLDRLDRRVPIKVIAAQLGISESRVNQHIRALKNHFGVESLGELVARARTGSGSGAEDPSRKPAYTNSQLPDQAGSPHDEDRVAPGEFVLADVAPFAIEAPWHGQHEPRVVPGVLDGENAVLFRLAVITGLAVGIIAAVLLVMTAALTVSEATEGRQVIVPEET
jgi:DNA-binding CsgD family transcriptional regulator